MSTIGTNSLKFISEIGADDVLSDALKPSSKDNISLTERRVESMRSCSAAYNSLERLLRTSEVLPDSFSRNLEKLADLIRNDVSSFREEKIIGAVNRLRLDLNSIGSDKILKKHASELLNKIYNCESASKVITDFPRITADGLIRSFVYCPSPGVLAALRESRNLDPVKADLVVIGGGPAGIAMTYYASSLGIDTVTLEAGYLAQGMSDARAQSVHVMRTGVKGSSLARESIVGKEHLESIGMASVLDRTAIRIDAARGREAIEEISGRKFNVPIPSESPIKDPSQPVSRSDVFGYFVEVAAEAAKSDKAIFIEQAPVSEATWDAEKSRFIIRTPQGHLVEAKYLAVAIGFVGSDGEFGRIIPEFMNLSEKDHEQCLIVANEGDFQKHSVKLAKSMERMRLTANKGPSEQMIIADPLLGHQEVQDYLSLLPNGTRTAVIGSGESAAKDAVELLRYANISVDLFVKEEIEPSQAHTPNFFTDGDAVVQAILNKKFGERSLNLMKKYFGTPITPETMAHLLNGMEEGRVRIFELGSYFSEDTLDIKLCKGKEVSTSIAVDCKNGEVLGNLKKQVKQMKDAGFTNPECILPKEEGDLTLSVINGPIIVAAGYNRKARLQTPLMKSLLEQGAIKMAETEKGGTEVCLDKECGIFSAAHSKLLLLGAGNLSGFSDTSFSGAGARAYLASHALSHQLGMSDTLLPEALSKWVAIEPKILPMDRENNYYPGNPMLSELHKRHLEGEDLKPMEKLLLLRAESLMQRMLETEKNKAS